MSPRSLSPASVVHMSAHNARISWIFSDGGAVTLKRRRSKAWEMMIQSPQCLSFVSSHFARTVARVIYLIARLDSGNSVSFALSKFGFLVRAALWYLNCA